MPIRLSKPATEPLMSLAGPDVLALPSRPQPYSVELLLTVQLVNTAVLALPSFYRPLPELPVHLTTKTRPASRKVKQLVVA